MPSTRPLSLNLLEVGTSLANLPTTRAPTPNPRGTFERTISLFGRGPRSVSGVLEGPGNQSDDCDDAGVLLRSA
jgi:hypothetical protein